MDTLVSYFAGAERGFRLGLGQFIDLEEACGCGVGALYKRFAVTDYSVQDVKHVLVQGLVGGGMTYVEAKALFVAQIEVRPVLELGTLATGIILAAMAGVEPDETAPEGDPDQKIDKGKLFHALLQVGLSPEQVRAMRYADFVALLRAAGGPSVQPPSEDEFADMVRAWKTRQEG